MFTICLIFASTIFAQDSLQRCLSTGNRISSEYGAIVLNGDSALAGRERKTAINSAINEALDTLVVNCAVGGTNANDMFTLQTSCSQLDSCATWSVMTIGMNQGQSGDEYNANDFVNRELSAGKKVIIQGHPDPRIAGGRMPRRYDVFMDAHAALSASNPDVFFIDTRTWIEFNTWDYFAQDQSHPSCLMASEMGKAIAEIIINNSISRSVVGSCLQEECPDLAKICNEDAACVDMFACFDGCVDQGVGPCINQCRTQIQGAPALFALHRPLFACANSQGCYDQESTTPDFRNVPYSDVDPRTVLDIYLSEVEGPNPLLIWVHGGGWRGGSKGGVNDKILAFRERGYTIASVEYRLSNHPYPATIVDVKAAIRWLRANAGIYDIDPNRFTAIGASAGGHLVSMLGTSAGEQIFEDSALGNIGVSSTVQAVVNFYGVTDILGLEEDSLNHCGQTANEWEGTPPALLLDCLPSECPDRANEASPLTYVSGDEPSFLTFHGTNDCVVPLNQGRRIHEALLANGVDSTLVAVQGAGHNINQCLAGRSSLGDNYDLMIDFIERHMKEQPSKHYVSCGRPNACTKGSEIMIDTTVMQVRCISDVEKQGWFHRQQHLKCADRWQSLWWESDIWGVCQRLSYDAAVEFCASVGARLPTLKEAEDGCIANSGCGFDRQQIWTSTSEVSIADQEFTYSLTTFGSENRRLTCSNPGQWLAQVCTRQSQCGVQQCKQECTNRVDCNFAYSRDNGICILFRACEQTQIRRGAPGDTFQKDQEFRISHTSHFIDLFRPLVIFIKALQANLL